MDYSRTDSFITAEGFVQNVNLCALTYSIGSTAQTSPNGGYAGWTGWGTAPPTGGVFPLGFVQYNSTPSVGSTPFWNVTTAGYVASGAWAGTTLYATGVYVTHSSNVYKAVIGGTSASTGPSRSVGTSVDGTVTWLHVAPTSIGAAVFTAGTNTNNVPDLTGPANSGWYNNGTNTTAPVAGVDYGIVALNATGVPYGTVTLPSGVLNTDQGWTTAQTISTADQSGSRQKLINTSGNEWDVVSGACGTDQYEFLGLQCHCEYQTISDWSSSTNIELRGGKPLCQHGGDERINCTLCLLSSEHLDSGDCAVSSVVECS